MGAVLIPAWAVLGIAGIVAVATGWLPQDQARDVALSRGGPVLGFLVAITVLAELSDRAGVFDAAARGCARLARGSVIGLFLLIAALGTLVTIGMSLDTTAVLLTPVVLTITERLGLRPLPFALLAVWLANTASLLLPVSNLTNLLAVQRLGLDAPHFAWRMALPELAAVVVTVAYLGLLHGRDLRGRYEMPAAGPRADRLLFSVCAVACCALAPGVLAGAPPWAVATPCALAAVLAFAVRRRHELCFSLVPWRLVILTEGLFLTVSSLAAHGLTDLLRRLVGDSVLQTTVVSAVASNGVNNLPAYLAVEPAVGPGRDDQLLGVLLGTNGGPLVLLWGSLATLLWRERCLARGLVISPVRFALVGLGGVPLVLLSSWLALRTTA